MSELDSYLHGNEIQKYVFFFNARCRNIHINMEVRKTPCGAADGARCPGDPTLVCECHVTFSPAHLPGRNQWQFLWRQGQQHGRQRWW